MIIFVYILTALLLVVAYVNAPVSMDENFIGIILLINLFAVVLFVLANLSRFRRNLFRHSIFFLYGYIIVHFQLLIEYFLHNHINLPFDPWVDKSIVCKAMVLSSIGLIVFLLGYEFYKFTLSRRNNNIINLKDTSSVSISSERYHYPVVLVILAYLSFLGFVFYADPRYLAGFYGSVDPGPAANRFQLLLTVFTSAIVIINSRALIINSYDEKSFYCHIKKMGFYFNLLVIVYILLTLYIGDRGPAIALILIYFAGYVFRVKNRPRSLYLVAAVFIGVTLMTFVGLYRATPQDLSFENRVELVFVNNQNISEGQPNELASSVRSINYAVSYVPNKVNYKYGWLQVRQILGAFPGVINILNLFDPNEEDRSSANLITYFDQGQFPTYGLGTTIIADFYIDLGIIGVVIGMFVFGYFISKFEYSIFLTGKNSLILFVFIMIFMSKSVYFARSSALNIFQVCIWVYIAIYLNLFFFKNLGKKFI